MTNPERSGDVIANESRVKAVGLNKPSTRGGKSWKKRRGGEGLHRRTESKVKNDLGEQSWGRRRGDPSQTWAEGGYEGMRV